VRRDTEGRAQGRFDAFELADTGGAINGVVNPIELPRLADRLVPPDDASSVRIVWRVTGGHDSVGRPMLTLSLEGTVFLVCQRCLKSFAVPVAQDTALLLARDEAELAVLDEAEPEVILAKLPLDPAMLVEDELLLALPFSPRHDERECAGAGTRRSATEAVQSPFAGLAQLKAGQGSKQ
jgi:uncharacterized protein